MSSTWRPTFSKDPFSQLEGASKTPTMADNLFEGLPPPSANPSSSASDELKEPKLCPKSGSEFSPSPAPIPVLKSALKRPKPIESKPEESAPVPVLALAPEKKKLRFKMTTDASEKQVIDAMQKITSHIKNPTKFGKASKLAIQLIQAGSVKPETSEYFFAILETAMSSSISCTDPSVRSDYHALFSAANDVSEYLNKKQRNQLTAWTIIAVVANDLLTDDSFVFSKAAGRVKELVSNLPVATEDEDIEEAVALKEETETASENGEINQVYVSAAPVEETSQQDSDPFGLDALIPNAVKKGEKTKGKKEATAKSRDGEETKRILKSQRQALITCLEIAARRYKTAWCQTVIDILVKYAFDNISRFTSQQRDAIEKLWASIREQQTRRKQGKSVTGKLDVNAFEWLQQQYAGEKISIRRAVGGNGERRAQQWLG